MEKARARVLVSGLVQGVFFRSYAVEEARSLNLTGWVKNRWDGRVEVLMEGDKEDINKMIAWLREGPPTAQVSDIEITWEKYSGEFNYFSVKYDM